MPTCYNAQPPSFCQPVLLYVETGCARLEERVNALTLARAVALGSPLTLTIGAIALLRRKIDRYELTSTIDPSHFFPTVEPRPRHSQGKRGAVGPGDGAGGHLKGYQDGRVGCRASSQRNLRSSASSNSFGNR